MRPETAPAASVTIEAETAEAFVRRPGSLDAGLIVLCDHADNALPGEYGSLGLPPSELERHIAYDIGARAVT
jgi:predicted N-formylglutamate amidohydrolase